MARSRLMIAVVTGASRGIGRAVAAALAAKGAHVTLVARDAARLEAVRDAIVQSAPSAPSAQSQAQARAQIGTTRLGSADVLPVDLARAGAGGEMINRVLARHGRVDLLIHCAGRSSAPQPIWELDEPALASTLAVNVEAAFSAARALATWATAEGSTTRIVALSSGVVARTAPHAVDYVTSKHALEGLVRALARDLYGSGVCVVGVALGPYRTTMAEPRYAPADFDRLPDPDAAVLPIERAASLPAAWVHGRILDERELKEGPPFRRSRRSRGTIDRDAGRRVALPCAPSPDVSRALGAMSLDAIAGLPGEGDALTQALCDELELPSGSVVLGAGISELLERTLALFVRPGEAVLANAPSWPLFPQLCAELDLAWQRVPYRVVQGAARHGTEDFAPKVNGLTRLVYLVSPGNPSGRALDETELLALLDALPPHLVVVVDEAYAEFVTRPGWRSAVQTIARHPERLIVLRTFSKFFGLGGMRIGYAIAAPPLARLLAGAATPFSISSAAQVAASAAWGDRAHRATTRAHCRDERERIVTALAERGVDHLATDAPFLLVRTRDGAIFDGYAVRPILSPAENDRWLADV